MQVYVSGGKQPFLKNGMALFHHFLTFQFHFWTMLCVPSSTPHFLCLFKVWIQKLVEKRPWFLKNLNYANRWRTLEVIKFHMFWVACCNITYLQKSHLSDFHSILYIDKNLGLSRKKKAFLSYFAKLGLSCQRHQRCIC